MTSVSAIATKTLFRAVLKHDFASTEHAVRHFRRILNDAPFPSVLPLGVSARKMNFAGVPCERLAPGKADLTARVDFGALKRAAEAADLSASAPVEQGGWLTALGIEQRAAALSMSGKADRGLIVRQLHRLTSDDQMGTLFKAMCLSAPELPSAPGF